MLSYRVIAGPSWLQMATILQQRYARAISTYGDGVQSGRAFRTARGLRGLGIYSSIKKACKFKSCHVDFGHHVHSD
jgi:hypothetical protein